MRRSEFFKGCQVEVKSRSCLVRAVFMAALALCLVAPLGCRGGYRTAVRPPLGAIYTHIHAPLTIDVNGNPSGGLVKRHSQKSTFYLRSPYLGRFLNGAWDDAAITRIANEGGIEEVIYADYEYRNIIGVFSQFTINVYGTPKSVE